MSAYVAGLLDDSPAESAGGWGRADVIISIGGERVISADAAIIAVRLPQELERQFL